MPDTFTIQQIEDTTHGWLVTNDRTKERRLVFCRLDNSSPEAAMELLNRPPPADPDAIGDPEGEPQ